MDNFFDDDQKAHLEANYPTLHAELLKDPAPDKVALAHALLRAAVKKVPLAQPAPAEPAQHAAAPVQNRLLHAATGKKI